MSRLTLERHQVWLYLVAIVAGLAVGSVRPDMGPGLEALLWPTLAVLLFATFLQVPLLHVYEALADRRFALAVLVGNFVLIPLLAWGLVEAFQLDDVTRLGVLLVLLVPCTDWFITFSQLGKGDVPRAIAITPLNLVAQLLLLPAYLWLMTDSGTVGQWDGATLAPALLIVLVPLGLAALVERWIDVKERRSSVREAMAWGPVPLLAVVVFLIAGAQVSAVRQTGPSLGPVLFLFVVFLVAAAVLARFIAHLLRLPAGQGRTLAFSLGTRNSFVVLPLALLLPSGWEMATVVIVAQSLVELLGMVAYVWLIPRYLFKDA